MGRLLGLCGTWASFTEWFFFSVIMGDLREMFLMASGIQATKGFPDEGEVLECPGAGTVP